MNRPLSAIPTSPFVHFRRIEYAFASSKYVAMNNFRAPPSRFRIDRRTNVPTGFCATRAFLAGCVTISVSFLLAPAAAAQPADTVADPSVPPVQVATPGNDNADPAAVAACGQFAEVLDSTATYYGDFADSLEAFAAVDYSDPAVESSNVVGRTALRQGAGVAMSAANTPGLTPAVAEPMRQWSVDATKLLIKMGLRGGRDTLNSTADEMNNDAIAAQQACAAAGTHA